MVGAGAYLVLVGFAPPIGPTLRCGLSPLSDLSSSCQVRIEFFRGEVGLIPDLVGYRVGTVCATLAISLPMIHRLRG